MMYVALKPNREPLGLRESMADAQALIAETEPDVLEQGKYQIHPIEGPRDAERLNLKLQWHIKLEKFDQTGELVETIEREGVN